MTEEREERILRVNEKQWNEIRECIWSFGEGVKTWDDLELVPKHTDEEYDDVWARLNSCQLEWARLKLRNVSRREGDR